MKDHDDAVPVVKSWFNCLFYAYEVWLIGDSVLLLKHLPSEVSHPGANLPPVPL